MVFFDSKLNQESENDNKSVTLLYAMPHLNLKISEILILLGLGTFQYLIFGTKLTLLKSFLRSILMFFFSSKQKTEIAYRNPREIVKS